MIAVSKLTPKLVFMERCAELMGAVVHTLVFERKLQPFKRYINAFFGVNTKGMISSINFWEVSTSIVD